MTMNTFIIISFGRLSLDVEIHHDRGAAIRDRIVTYNMAPGGPAPGVLFRPRYTYSLLKCK